jgi:predicted DNA-binding protein (UPF0251 family)
MVRPRRCRHVWHNVDFDYFKPRGVTLRELEEVNLNVEELEAIRLNDLLDMEQVAASEKMKVSQPTYSRILKDARKKVADALINGKAIKIQGGVYKMPNRDGTGPRGLGPGTGWGLGYCEVGNGKGFGRGYGWRRSILQKPVAQQQINEQKYLEEELKSVEQEEKILQQEKERIIERLKSVHPEAKQNENSN